LLVRVTLPANVTAEVRLPAREGEAVYELGSGRYDFDATLDESARQREAELAVLA